MCMELKSFLYKLQSLLFPCSRTLNNMTSATPIIPHQNKQIQHHHHLPKLISHKFFHTYQFPSQTEKLQQQKNIFPLMKPIEGTSTQIRNQNSKKQVLALCQILIMPSVTFKLQKSISLNQQISVQTTKKGNKITFHQLAKENSHS